MLHSVLSIAGSDSSGGAGIQADIKAISATGAYAASVITALTAQNTQGVQAIESVSPAFVTQQINAVCDDLEIQSIKIGMLHTQAIIERVRAAILKYKPRYVVLDPVMVSKNGSALLDDVLIHALKKLFAHVTLLTPNLLEAEKITGESIQSTDDMARVARLIATEYHTNVLLKGGHLNTPTAQDVLCEVDNTLTWFTLPRVDTQNTHGTGCTLSAAIASYLAQGKPLKKAVLDAKQYLYQAILSGSQLSLGKGYGPVHHFYRLEKHAFIAAAVEC
jgi:hydroxymethylpyrimidine/phosphomethylpyrimidine kinase